MKLTQRRREKIIRLSPNNEGRFLDAVIYIRENACKWRALPETFGYCHTIYVRINRRAENGEMERIFRAIQEEQITNKRVTALSMDSSSLKAQ